MFGLKIGDVINTKNQHGSECFEISLFETDKLNNTWAILGKVKFLENFGHYGDRMWLIAVNGKQCWEKSKWYKMN